MAEQRVSNERKKELEQIDPFQESLSWAKTKPGKINKTAVMANIALTILTSIFNCFIKSLHSIFLTKT